MNKLLIIGDAVVSTGFSRAVHHLAAHLAGRWEITILGIGFNGDPHSFPFKVYPAFIGGDVLGVNRTAELVRVERPDVVFLQNDPWNIPHYVKEIRSVDENVPIVASVAVDGKNCAGKSLNGLSHAIFWTEFGKREAVAGGYTGPSSIIPLGVDRSTYFPMEKAAAHDAFGFALPEDGFFVGNVNRNQPRKRLDLTLAYFAEWIHSRNIDNAYLFLHVCPTGDIGCDIKQLVSYFRLQGRVIRAEPDRGLGESEARLRATYNLFDVQLTTTQGEGFGLPTLEGMACGVPQIVPDWSALGDWPGDAVLRVPCTSTAITPNGVNVIGGVADRRATIEALDVLYRDSVFRLQMKTAAFEHAANPQFRWDAISAEIENILAVAAVAKGDAVLQEA